MKDFFLKLKSSFLAFWNKLSLNQKILFGSGLFLILIVATVLVIIASRPNFVPLYVNLDPQDAAAITEYLKEKKIPYKLSDEGSTVLVPASQKYQLRLDLANEGLPKGGSIGFEYFNQTHFGETESERKIRYLVALQGELERTIRKLEAVEDVRIHIVIPEPSLFIEKEKDATASVLLKLKPGHTLNDQQVLGITRLVASGVEGLKPENVTVVDTFGNVLSEGLNGNEDVYQPTRLTENQLQIKNDFENRIEKSIRTMLERIVGQGKVVVRANAILDFDRIEIRQEDYGDKTVRSQQITEESSSSSNSNPVGVPGTGSNVPTYAQAVNQQGTGQYQKTEKTTNYEVDKQEQVRVVAPGQIKQLSLSVVIDGQLDALRQREIEDLVASAAGLQPERGDTITVTGMPFNTSWEQQLEKEMAASKRRQQMITYGAIVAVVAGILILIWLMRKRHLQSEIDYLADGRITVEDVMEPEGPQMTEEEKERARTIEQIQRLVRQNPKDVANLLKSWMADDSR